MGGQYSLTHYESFSPLTVTLVGPESDDLVRAPATLTTSSLVWIASQPLAITPAQKQAFAIIAGKFGFSAHASAEVECVRFQGHTNVSHFVLSSE